MNIDVLLNAPKHPARDASISSMRNVLAGDREAWIDLFADDAVIEDPVGPSPYDPEGRGHHGKETVAAFWDNIVSQVTIQPNIRQSIACGNECLNGGIFILKAADGSVTWIDMVINYAVDEHGKIKNLRAFWEFDQLEANKV
ncbi:nuclear transport factor 2 family protein [Parahaliea sp. F7430]|uniref:Nuclear transport factor 2 family protein n=1 Tax=Sediminihaliea albiluteola TaxID=2758564 RepID=A0A7W2TTN5_9GAMM|nr:nuclear transport factor 2 family protein [Sediminihaliea albiluteola]MBA6411719.1 nuclear transport factor 2 family protein [Sediminihaliea albiluteola]